MNRSGLLSTATLSLAVAFLSACQLAPAPPAPAFRDVVEIVVRDDGTIVLDGKTVTPEELKVGLEAMAARDPQPEIHIAPDRLAKYGVIAHVMAAAQRAGLRKMGVIGGT